MILFRAEKQRPNVGMEPKRLLIYARSEAEAIAYLKTVPLFWGEDWQPSDFREVIPPKGPSPSLLMYDIGSTISSD